MANKGRVSIGRKVHYFSHDTDARNDPKIQYLEKQFTHAYMMFFKTLEVLGSSETNTIPYSKEVLSNLALEFRVGIAEYLEFINIAIQINALCIDNDEIYSNGLMNRIEPILAKRQRDRANMSVKVKHFPTAKSIFRQRKINFRQRKIKVRQRKINFTHTIKMT